MCAPRPGAAIDALSLIVALGVVACSGAPEPPNTAEQTRQASPAKRAMEPEHDRPDPRDVLVLQAGGDVAYPFGFNPDRAWEAAGAELFADLAPLLSQGDVNFANLEGPWTYRGQSDPANHVLVSSPHRFPWLVTAGFNLFSVANNHSLDAGLEGLADTIKLIRSEQAAGHALWLAGGGDTPEDAQKPVVLTIPGKRERLAVFAMTRARFRNVDHGVAAHERIAAAAAQGDTVVVSVHDGTEFVHVPSAKIAAQYRGYVDAGARVVLGHHPHVAQGIERYKNGVIFYSLGNLSFGVSPDRERTKACTELGVFARVTLRNGELDEVRGFPIYTSNVEPLRAGSESLPPRFARPQLLSGVFATEAAERLVGWSAAVPGAQPTKFRIEGDALVAEAD